MRSNNLNALLDAFGVIVVSGESDFEYRSAMHHRSVIFGHDGLNRLLWREYPLRACACYA